MDKKYERNLEKSFNEFQKRYYSMDDIPTDGEAPPIHRRPKRRRMQMSPSTLDEKINSVRTKLVPTPTKRAIARADTTNAVKRQLEAEKRQNREEQSVALAVETRRDMLNRSQQYNDKVRNLQYDTSVESGHALASPYEGGLSKQMIAGSVAAYETRRLKPVVPQEARASQYRRQNKAGRRSTLPVGQIPTSRDRPIDLGISATGAQMRSLSTVMRDLNVDSDSEMTG